jgi:hypothetical protein
VVFRPGWRMDDHRSSLISTMGELGSSGLLKRLKEYGMRSPS